MTQSENRTMWVLLAAFALGGVLVFAGLPLLGAVLCALVVFAVWRLDK